MEMKLYKPNYATLLLLGGFMLLFVIMAIISTMKSGGIDSGLFIPILVITFIFIVIELLAFSRAIEFYEEEMKINTGLGYLLGFSPRSLRYDQINLITENISANLKFSNLKIYSKNKQYVIFIRGVRDYEKMKSELIAYKPEGVEVKGTRRFE